jgi:hypothetical protein
MRHEISVNKFDEIYLEPFNQNGAISHIQSLIPFPSKKQGWLRPVSRMP